MFCVDTLNFIKKTIGNQSAVEHTKILMYFTLILNIISIFNFFVPEIINLRRNLVGTIS